jgi:hypothetical protein
MPIPFRCPSCGNRISAPDAAAGKILRCSSCKTPLKVPAASPPVRRSADALAPEPIDAEEWKALDAEEASESPRRKHDDLAILAALDVGESEAANHSPPEEWDDDYESNAPPEPWFYGFLAKATMPVMIVGLVCCALGFLATIANLSSIDRSEMERSSKDFVASICITVALFHVVAAAGVVFIACFALLALDSARNLRAVRAKRHRP